MNTLAWLIKNFFTHKDFLPSADQIPGTLFTPLHFVVAAVFLAVVVAACIFFSKRSHKTIQTVFACVWAVAVVMEIVKIVWETVSGASVNFEWGGVLPLYPCSIFMYALPFAIWGKGMVRYAACGYVCSLGILGGAINFIYPANILSNYSALSFSGFHTLFYHGAIVFCAVTMLASGYHSYGKATKWYHLFIPAIPCLVVSVFANAVNFSPIASDYMFFKLNSFFFAPIGAATPDILSVVLVYFIYLLIHALPYIPCYIKNRTSN